MREYRFSDKQAELALLGSRPGRYVLVSGPARCGKSDSAIAGFMHYANRNYSGCDFAVVSKSQSQMDGVILAKIAAWCNRNKVPFRQHVKHWSITNYHGSANRFWHVIAAEGTETAASRVQGLGLAGVYIDEFTRVPEALVSMLVTRMLEYPESKLIATMNPEGPDHWAKINWIDRVQSEELNGEYMQFALSDNPILNAESIAELAHNFNGAFYRRMILGEWAASTGLVHPVVDYKPLPDAALPYRYEVALDFGLATVTHAVLIAYHPNGWTVVDEWRHDGRDDGQMPVREQGRQIHAWATRGRSVSAWAIPKDAHGLAEHIEELAKGNVFQAVDKVNWGVQALNKKLETKLTIDPRCEYLRQELASFSWNETSGKVGDDKVDKKSANGAHGCDALRYWAASHEAASTGRRP